MAIEISARVATEDEVLAVLARRLAAGQPSSIIDRGVRSSAAQIPGLELAEEVALLDPGHEDGRWQSLLEICPESLSTDLQELARTFRVWTGVSTPLSEEEALHNTGGSIDSPVSLQKFLIWACYGAGDMKQPILAKGGVDNWRVFLRKLGEGPTTVFQDPWFGRLFLSGGPQFPLEASLILANLQAPRMPLYVAKRTANVFVYRVLSHARRVGRAPVDIAIFLADGSTVSAAVDAALQEFVAHNSDSALEMRVEVCSFSTYTGPDAVPSARAEALVQLTRVKHSKSGQAVDTELYGSLPVAVDKWHRPDYVKGIAYGFDRFCVIEGGKFPETLERLHGEDISLGATVPLLDSEELHNS